MTIRILWLVLLTVGCTHVRTRTSQASDFRLRRKHYELSYNEHHEVPNWVSYTLEPEKLRACVKRNDDFRPDPNIPTGSAALADYKGSGFDRGHLLPAGDMKFDREAMSDTFYLSNIAPQPGRFNRGKWSQLEILVRAWALKYQKLWIVTGPILNNSLPFIGKLNHVSVPYEFFKVILRKDGNSYKGAGFIMNTDSPYRDLAEYSVDINTVENLSGQDFFKFLPPTEEEQIEGNFEPFEWDFTARFEYLPCGAPAAR